MKTKIIVLMALVTFGGTFAGAGEGLELMETIFVEPPEGSKLKALPVPAWLYEFLSHQRQGLDPLPETSLLAKESEPPDPCFAAGNALSRTVARLESLRQGLERLKSAAKVRTINIKAQTTAEHRRGTPAFSQVVRDLEQQAAELRVRLEVQRKSYSGEGCKE